ncbi:MAG TPA: SMI1/KNR4 family protein [Pirellulales bacterium]|nr:SMI1/KNR4 family protein [Pirellulales bacterium]
MGVVFRADYRRFILQFNGGYFADPLITPVGQGCPTECLDSLFGIGASHPSSELGDPADIGLFDGNDPPIIVPIGRTAVGGLIILDTAPGEERGSIFLKQAFGDFYYLTDGIERFFALLRDSS